MKIIRLQLIHNKEQVQFLYKDTNIRYQVTCEREKKHTQVLIKILTARIFLDLSDLLWTQQQRWFISHFSNCVFPRRETKMIEIKWNFSLYNHRNESNVLQLLIACYEYWKSVLIRSWTTMEMKRHWQLPFDVTLIRFVRTCFTCNWRWRFFNKCKWSLSFTAFVFSLNEKTNCSLSLVFHKISFETKEMAIILK